MTLEARRADLERQIRVASSRQVLVPIVERALGLHEPADSEFVLFAVPRRPGGALMAKPTARIAAIQFGFALGILAVLTRAAQLQIVEAERWEQEAARQRTEKVVLPARRGALYDRNGIPLAITQEFYHVGIAPNELEDVRRGVRAAGAEPRRVGAGAQSGVPGAEALDLPPRPVHRDAGAAAPRGCSGIHLDGRVPALLSLARPRAADHRRARARSAGRRLGARAGARLAAHRRAGRGGAAQGPRGPPLRLARPEDPRPGARATTSRSRSTRSCRRSPSAGSTTRIAQMQAEGGDVVFLDPNTGELLALASRQAAGGGRAERVDASPTRSSRARPPSCSPRPRCCMRDRVDSTDAVSGENGAWNMPVTSTGRTRRITDAHAAPRGCSRWRAPSRCRATSPWRSSPRGSGPRSSSRCCATSASARPTGVEFPAESRGHPGAARIAGSRCTPAPAWRWATSSR